MTELRHIYITVNSDMKKEQNFEGTLADLACDQLNKELADIMCGLRIISINETRWINEIHPREDNSNTWYDREYLKLSVYYYFEV